MDRSRCQVCKKSPAGMVRWPTEDDDYICVDCLRAEFIELKANHELELLHCQREMDGELESSRDEAIGLQMRCRELLLAKEELEIEFKEAKVAVLKSCQDNCDAFGSKSCWGCKMKFAQEPDEPWPESEAGEPALEGERK